MVFDGWLRENSGPTWVCREEATMAARGQFHAVLERCQGCLISNAHAVACHLHAEWALPACIRCHNAWVPAGELVEQQRAGLLAAEVGRVGLVPRWLGLVALL